MWNWSASPRVMKDSVRPLQAEGPSDGARKRRGGPKMGARKCKGGWKVARKRKGGWKRGAKSCAGRKNRYTGKRPVRLIRVNFVCHPGGAIMGCHHGSAHSLPTSDPMSHASSLTLRRLSILLFCLAPAA